MAEEKPLKLFELEKIYQKISKYILKEEKIAIALSGGVDSIFLTYILKDHYNIIALHLNHNLRSNSIKEEKFVKDFCKMHAVELQTFQWHGKYKKNLEAEAREARYSILTNYCKNNNIKYLLTAHHANDQIETFLMNLSRGSGIDGLSSVAEIAEINDIKIIRPMLEIYKKDLENYANLHKLNYVFDESNDDVKFQRNRLRKILYKYNQENSNLLNSRLLNTIQIMQQSKLMLDDMMQNLLLELTIKCKNKYLIHKKLFLNKPKCIQFALLNYILKDLSLSVKSIRRSSIEIILNEIQKNHLKCKKIQDITISLNNFYIEFINLDN
jgi:tRNA(Ile)-lysidine synthase